MSSIKSWSLRLQLLGLSALIVLVCIFAGGYITRELLEREKSIERDFNKRMRPHDRHAIMIKELVGKGLDPHEAFRIIEKTANHHAPYTSYLIDKNKKVIDSFPEDAPANPDLNHCKKIPLGYDIFLAYPKEEKRFGPPPEGPPPFGPKGGGPDHFRGPPPPGARLIGIVAIAASVIVGLGLSIIFLTFFVRRKSREAEQVILKLKSGDLKARFKISQVDESSLLMRRFNEMADQIEELVNNLRTTEKARVLLLQELAHDLRTPVASLKNLQEMLLDKGHLLDEEKKRHAQFLAIKEVQYFEHLVEDLLFLSGVNDPRYSSHLKNLELSPLIEEISEGFENDKIKIELHQENDLHVLGDEHLLRRLIKNALSNASRFARKLISIQIIGHDNQVLVRIIDDGPGIPEKDLAQFGLKKFSRHMEESKDNISIGLGSVIMKKIMSLHDGDMSVQNHADGGLVLTFKFPRI